jgi:hypothetical protein
MRQEFPHNIRRAIFRVWIVLSSAWTLFVVVTTVGNMKANAPNYGWGIEFWRGPLLAMLIPWTIAAAIIGVSWIYRGFHSN